jgi:membrane fusion protein (multidrug efflux system)
MQVVFPNTQDLLKVGMNAKVRMTILPANGQLSLVVPEKSIRRLLNEVFVWVYDPKEQVVRERKVVLGYAKAGQQVIEQGLEQGEQVVTQGVQKLKENQKIQPLENTNL